MPQKFEDDRATVLLDPPRCADIHRAMDVSILPPMNFCSTADKYPAPLTRPMHSGYFHDNTWQTHGTSARAPPAADNELLVDMAVKTHNDSAGDVTLRALL
jgi:hypothetical protein